LSYIVKEDILTKLDPKKTNTGLIAQRPISELSTALIAYKSLIDSGKNILTNCDDITEAKKNISDALSNIQANLPKKTHDQSSVHKTGLMAIDLSRESDETKTISAICKSLQSILNDGLLQDRKEAKPKTPGPS